MEPSGEPAAFVYVLVFTSHVRAGALLAPLIRLVAGRGWRGTMTLHGHIGRPLDVVLLTFEDDGGRLPFSEVRDHLVSAGLRYTVFRGRQVFLDGSVDAAWLHHNLPQ